MFQEVTQRVVRGKEPLDNFLPMLELIARQYAGAWLLLAALYTDLGSEKYLQGAKDALERYLGSGQGKPSERFRAWKRLASLCQRTNDVAGEVHALVDLCQMGETAFSAISQAAYR